MYGFGFFTLSVSHGLKLDLPGDGEKKGVNAVEVANSKITNNIPIGRVKPKSESIRCFV